MKKKRRNQYNNCKNSKIGDACRICNNSSTNNFAKNKSAITDNEYEVTSETKSCNCSNKKRCR